MLATALNVKLQYVHVNRSLNAVDSTPNFGKSKQGVIA